VIENILEVARTGIKF